MRPALETRTWASRIARDKGCVPVRSGSRPNMRDVGTWRRAHRSAVSVASARDRATASRTPTAAAGPSRPTPTQKEVQRGAAGPSKVPGPQAPSQQPARIAPRTAASAAHWTIHARCTARHPRHGGKARTEKPRQTALSKIAALYRRLSSAARLAAACASCATLVRAATASVARQAAVLDVRSGSGAGANGRCHEPGCDSKGTLSASRPAA